LWQARDIGRCDLDHSTDWHQRSLSAEALASVRRKAPSPTQGHARSKPLAGRRTGAFLKLKAWLVCAFQQNSENDKRETAERRE
jgi:hypothetical protein